MIRVVNQQRKTIREVQTDKQTRVRTLPRQRVVAVVKTRSHPEMVGDMSRVTLNSDVSKIPFVHF